MRQFFQFDSNMRRIVTILFLIILICISYVLFYRFIDYKVISTVPYYPHSTQTDITFKDNFFGGNSRIIFTLNTTDSLNTIMSYYEEKLKREGWKDLTPDNAINTLGVPSATSNSDHIMNNYTLTKNIDDVVYFFGDFKRDEKDHSRVQFAISYQLRESAL